MKVGRKIKNFKLRSQPIQAKISKHIKIESSKEKIVVKSNQNRFKKNKEIYVPPSFNYNDYNKDIKPPQSCDTIKKGQILKNEIKTQQSNRIFGPLKLILRTSTDTQDNKTKLPFLIPPKNLKEQFRIKHRLVLNNDIKSPVNTTKETDRIFSYKEFSYNENQNENCRKSMEDFSDINPYFYHDDQYKISFFALYDGFCGKEVAVYLQKNLQQCLFTHIKKNKFDIEKSFGDTFAQMENSIKEISNSSTCGSTATVALIVNKIIYCANIGNSSCYSIYNKNQIKKISIDHDCKNQNEILRVKQNGGEIFNKRVFGALSLTRCFGDFDFKAYGVTAKPTISKKKIGKEENYLIIASDGVWDVINEEELKGYISKKNLSASELSALVINEALKNYSRDNVSCIVIKF